MKLSPLTLILGAVVCLVACKSTPPEGAYIAASRPSSPEAANADVVLLNSDLMRTLAVDKPVVVDRDSANRLRVQVGLRNRVDNENLQVQVQTLWKTDAGRILYSEPGAEAAWQTLTISANQTLYYSQTALTEEATKYTIRIRYTAKSK